MSATDSTMISTTFPATTAQEPMPKTVRLFTVGTEEFVMRDELRAVLNGAASIPDSTIIWYTIDGEIAKAMAKRSKETIDFVPTPLDQKDGDVQPVISPLGDECLLASDALSEIMRFLIFNLQVFRNCDERWKLAKIADYFSTLEGYFKFTEKSRFFIFRKKVTQLRDLAVTEFSCFPKAQNVGTIATNPDGIKTLLKLGVLLPNTPIAERADLLLALAKYKKLDIFAFAISCVIERSNKLTQFIHTQKSCHRLLTCKFCLMEKNASGLEGLEKSVESNLEKAKELIQKAKDLKKEEAEKTEVVQKKTKKRSKKVKNAAPKDSDEVETVEVQEAFEIPTEPETPEVVTTPEAPAIPEPQPTCQKCTRTTARCNEAKEKLKESQKSTEKMEKKLSKERKEWEKKMSEKDMELEELKREFVKYQQEQAAQQEALKIQLVQSEEKSALLQMENDQLAEKNVKLQEELTVAQRIPEPVQEEVKEDEEEEREPIDFEQMLEDLQNKQSQLNQENPLDAAAKEVRKLKGLTEDLELHEFADMEMEHFEEQYLIYSSALEQNINAIQADNLEAIIPIPAYPTLSDEFKKSLELAQELRNKQLERECVICSDEMDLEKKEELFECPVCGKSVHLECIETWFNTTRNCVHCRAEWK